MSDTDPVLADLQDRLERARNLVRGLENQIESHRAVRAAEAALFQGKTGSGPSPRAEPKQGPKATARTKTKPTPSPLVRVAQPSGASSPVAPYGVRTALNPGRSWAMELRSALDRYPNGATVKELVEDLRRVGMSFGHHNPSGMVSTKLVEGKARGHFTKSLAGFWSNTKEPISLFASHGSPAMRPPLNADGRSWAEVIDQVLVRASAAGRTMTATEIAAELSKQGRNFGKMKPGAQVRSVLRARASSLGWAKLGNRWGKLPQSKEGVA